ncbi:MAG: NAD-dependent epimerase/dehydratase family protein [Pseudomonadales bacterium]
MKVLVTGATGFTGLNLSKALAKAGHQVLALARDSSDCSALEATGIECLRIDLFDTEGVRGAMEQVEVVYHLAAAYRTEHADQSEFWRVNVEATQALLENAAAAGVRRFVHCSTVGVQGEITEPPAAEDYRLKPGDHYQASKLEGEQRALEFNGRDGLETTVIRPVGIYGPGDDRFLKLFKAIDRGLFLMIGSGQTLYHMTYIDDLVQGFQLAGTHDAAPGEVFTICGPEVGTLNELAQVIANALDKKLRQFRVPLWPVLAAAHVSDWLFKRFGAQSPLYPRRVEFFRFSRAFTSEKAQRMLGYEPEVSLNEGVRRTIAAYRQEGLL